MSKLVTIVDYGMGNLRSVTQAAEHVAPNNTQILVSGQADAILNADAIIFPGQGAAKACMQAIHEAGLEDALKQAASEKPFLGICMGLQVLMSHSDENNGVPCLGILPGQVKHFELEQTELKVPHMGWNQIHQMQAHPLWHGIQQDSRFYFVHSYFVEPETPNWIQGQTTHGQTFASVLAHDNMFAIQAHPEKSAQAGLQLFENFLNWNGH